MPRTLPLGNVCVNPQDIYRQVNFLHPAYMDIGEIRRNNLRTLIRDRFGGVQRALADAIGRQPDYVSRCLSGRKKIGEDFARIIEQSLTLPRNWMDQPQEASESDQGPFDAYPPDLRELVNLYNGITSDQRKNFLRELRKTKERNDKIIEELSRKRNTA